MSQPARTQPEPAPLETFPDDIDSVLCVVAHPDDLEYGTSAAVAAWTSTGKRVAYWLATRGEAGIDTMAPAEAAHVRAAEQRAACAAVGVEDLTFGAHPDGVVEYGLALRRDIAREIRRHRPDLVLTLAYHERFAGGMLNQADHRAVGLACVDALADAGNRWVFPELIDDGFEPWSVPWLAIAAAEQPTHYVEVADAVEAGIASLEAHAAYNSALPQSFPRPRDLVTSILSAGGQAAGVEFAAAFECIRRG
ncbi:MAG: PIG-L deacetylase family protein [Tetrasphaera sp.]